MKITPSPEVRHLKPLDGLRGLAILVVMLSHCFELNFITGSRIVLAFGYTIRAGRYGVDLFFVLSGFLITGILIDTRHDPHFFSRFFGRRALRILPLYYGSLFVLLLLTIPFHWDWHGMTWPLLTYLQNWWPYTLDRLAVGPNIGLYHFWSLAIEEQFYLLWPFAVFALRRNKNALLWTATAGVCAVPLLRTALIVHGVSYLPIHENLFTRADSLLVGGLLAMAYRNQKAWDFTLRYGPAVCLVCLGLVALHVEFPNVLSSMYLDADAQYTMLAFGMAGLLTWSLKPDSLPRKFFELPVLRTLGKYSYGLYVLHVFVLSLNQPMRLWLHLHTGSVVFSGIAAGLLCLMISFVAAWLSFHLYEKQFSRLKHHFDYTIVDPARTTN